MLPDSQDKRMLLILWVTLCANFVVLFVNMLFILLVCPVLSSARIDSLNHSSYSISCLLRNPAFNPRNLHVALITCM